MKKLFAITIGFLALWVAGAAGLRSGDSVSCGDAGGCCCCDDSAALAPCFCEDDSEFEFPEMAIVAGVALARPVSGDFFVREAPPLVTLLPRWHPALPWHGPPEEMRARLGVWVL